jgi:hypothetical protein
MQEYGTLTIVCTPFGINSAIKHFEDDREKERSKITFDHRESTLHHLNHKS